MVRPKPRRLTLEQLEDRSVPATFNVPWGDASHLTLSFVPDGTRIAGHRSTLFEMMNTLGQPDWQQQIVRAFQTWAVQANIDIGIRADGGQTLGVAGRVQGDSRFGDIRIAAHNMTREVFAVSVPHDPFLSGTLAGDVFLNSTPGGFGNGGADLFSVMLHEAGHVLGLDHNSDPTSVMFSHANPDHTELGVVDIANLQALYGTRGPDLNDADKPNETMNDATRIDPRGDGSTPLLSFGDITTHADVDFFSFQPFSNYQGPLTFRLQTAGVSLLAPRLTVLDENGQVIDQVASTNPLGDTVAVTIPQADPNMTYYVKVDSSAVNEFGIGRFGLAVTFDSLLTTPEADINAAVQGRFDALSSSDIDKIFTDPDDCLFGDDEHGDDDAGSAVELKTTAGYAKGTHYETIGSLSDSGDPDWFTVESLETLPGEPNVMTITTMAMDLNGAVPLAELFTTNLVPVPAQILANGNGTFTIQATNLPADTEFLVKLTPRSGDAGSLGNYNLTIDNGRIAAQLDHFSGGSVRRRGGRQAEKLFVAESQLFQFLLSVDASAASPHSSVVMTILNGKGKSVFTMSARAGETVSAPSIFLDPGTYKVKYTVKGTASAAATLNFDLLGSALGSPVGPVSDDPTLQPLFTKPGRPGQFFYTNGTISTIAFLWTGLGV